MVPVPITIAILVVIAVTVTISMMPFIVIVVIIVLIVMFMFPPDQVITVGASRPVRSRMLAMLSAAAIRSASASCVSMLWRVESGS